MRDATAAFLAELAKRRLRPVIFYEGEFSTGTSRAWSGYGEKVWNGQTWQGVGHLGGISAIEETGDVKATGIVVQLTGVATENIALALGEARQGKPGKVWLGFLDEAGNVIVDPYLAFSGRLDVPEIEEGAETATVRISYESRLIDLERPRARRYTHEDQQIDFPGDKGFEFVPSLQDAQIVWGVGGTTRGVPRFHLPQIGGEDRG